MCSLLKPKYCTKKDALLTVNINQLHTDPSKPLANKWFSLCSARMHVIDANLPCLRHMTGQLYPKVRTSHVRIQPSRDPLKRTGFCKIILTEMKLSEKNQKGQICSKYKLETN